MICREFEADIVDLARGAGPSVEAESRLREHLAACAGCAARFAREQRLTAALREVAGSAPAPSRSEDIEAHLLTTFAAQHAAGPQETAPPRASDAVRWPWRWLAAAAVLLLAVVTWRGTGSWQSRDAAGPVPAAATAVPPASLPSAPVVEPRAAPPAPRRAEATIPAPRLGASPPAVPARAGAARDQVRPAAAEDDEGVLRFASLPTAIGLPALESGRIVRVELATAVLPAFGFDVVPASEPGVVEADVLVGQDDQPRAIRFVSLEKVYRRRQ